MHKEKSYLESSIGEQDTNFEIPLRPQSLENFIGQKHLHRRLRIYMEAAKQRSEALGHCLFYGPPGLGKTTLANIIAKEMNANITITSGPVIDKAGDLAGILTKLQDGDVLFIDEIHRLNKTIEEYLYPAIEDYSLDLLVDSGPSSRSVQVKLKRFTLIGATTRIGQISSPLRSRFGFTCRLEYYDPEVLEKILLRSGQLLKINLSQEAAREIANRSRGTPRIANNLLRFVRDFAQINKHPVIKAEMAKEALEMLSIDDQGLDEVDKKLLEILIENFDGGPVGLKTLAVALGEEDTTLSEVYEPFLIMKGFIKRTPRGREATEKAYQHLKGN